MRYLVKTDYDRVSKLRPKLLQDVRALASTSPPTDYALTASQLLGEAEKQYLIRTLADWAKGNLDRRVHPVDRMGHLDVIRCVPQDVAERMLGLLQQEYLASYNFIAHGEKTFFFTEPLVQRLAHTELNVDVELLRPPFPCCMFVFDDDVTREALYALWNQTPPNSAPVTVYVSIFLEKGRKTLGVQAIHGTTEHISTMLLRSLNLGDSKTVEDALRTDWSSDPERRKAREVILGEKIFDTDAAFYGPGLRFFRILANAVLYLNSTHPDLGQLVPPPRIIADARTPKPERKQAVRDAAQYSILPYIPVGASLEPVDDLQSDRPAAAENSHTLNHRIKVQGHWREQAHGPRHSLRKLIYIEPFWKGPDAAEVLNRPYVVR